MNTINVHCPITTKTGYGISSTYITKALLQNGCKVHLFPIGNAEVESGEDEKIVVGLFEDTILNWNQKNPCLKIWHQWDLANRIGNGKYGALVFFELNKLRQPEVVQMNNTDVTFVASEWAKKVLEDNGVKAKIVVSPLAVDTSIFKPVLRNPNPNFTFINIGKWELRKGHDILVEAFNAAFTDKDNVELWMMNHNIFLTDQENKIWQNLYKNSKLGNKIKIVDRVATHTQLADVIALADCGVFPARAEGWNNEILEVMAMNKPIITTNYSAHTEYCTKDNSYLVEIDKLSVANDGKWFNGFGEWADLGKNQFEQLVNHMREVYSKGIRSNLNGLETAKKYTWNNTANIIYSELCDANPIKKTK